MAAAIFAAVLRPRRDSFLLEVAAPAGAGRVLPSFLRFRGGTPETDVDALAVDPLAGVGERTLRGEAQQAPRRTLGEGGYDVPCGPGIGRLLHRRRIPQGQISVQRDRKFERHENITNGCGRFRPVEPVCNWLRSRSPGIGSRKIPSPSSRFHSRAVRRLGAGCATSPSGLGEGTSRGPHVPEIAVAFRETEC